jgi:hypothetical protein
VLSEFLIIKPKIMDAPHKTPAKAFTISGDWAEQSKRLKAKFPILTDADLRFEHGKETELISRLQTRLNLDHDDVVDAIRSVQLEKV